VPWIFAPRPKAVRLKSPSLWIWPPFRNKPQFQTLGLMTRGFFTLDSRVRPEVEKRLREKISNRKNYLRYFLRPPEDLLAAASSIKYAGLSYADRTPRRLQKKSVKPQPKCIKPNLLNF
jgi:hypothetical protein